MKDYQQILNSLVKSINDKEIPKEDTYSYKGAKVIKISKPGRSEQMDREHMQNLSRI